MRSAVWRAAFAIVYLSQVQGQLAPCNTSSHLATCTPIAIDIPGICNGTVAIFSCNYSNSTMTACEHESKVCYGKGPFDKTTCAGMSADGDNQSRANAVAVALGSLALLQFGAIIVLLCKIRRIQQRTGGSKKTKTRRSWASLGEVLTLRRRGNAHAHRDVADFPPPPPPVDDECEDLRHVVTPWAKERKSLTGLFEENEKALGRLGAESKPASIGDTDSGRYTEFMIRSVQGTKANLASPVKVPKLSSPTDEVFYHTTDIVSPQPNSPKSPLSNYDTPRPQTAHAQAPAWFEEEEYTVMSADPQAHRSDKPPPPKRSVTLESSDPVYTICDGPSPVGEAPEWTDDLVYEDPTCGATTGGNASGQKPEDSDSLYEVPETDPATPGVQFSFLGSARTALPAYLTALQSRGKKIMRKSFAI